ncbi:hypothetical protein ABZ354_18150 [Streptomyces sp. NPDC005925]
MAQRAMAALAQIDDWIAVEQRHECSRDPGCADVERRRGPTA